jgi:hypothetical protein
MSRWLANSALYEGGMMWWCTSMGKTIGELSNGVWEDQRTFEKIRAELQKRLPDTTFVPFTEFPIGSEQIDSDAAIERLVAKGVDAVITGNAA